MSSPLSVSIWGRNEIDSFGLRHILAEAGFEIEHVMAGESDTDFGGWKDDPHHLILVDSSTVAPALPRCAALRSALPHARIALLCDSCTIDTAKQAFAASVDGLLSTRMAAEAMLYALRLVALGTKVMPSEIIQELVAGKQPSMLQDMHGRDVQPELSDREIQILQCLAAGDANKEIASRLSVAEATVKAHVKAILRKLQVDNRTQAAIWAINQGKLSDDDDSSVPPVKH